MSNVRNFDIIIAGAGASGLGLAWEIMRRPDLSEYKVLVADRSLSPIRDKTWCFWDKKEMLLGDFIHHSWTSLEFRACGQVVSEQLKGLRYHCIKSDEFTEIIYSQLVNHGNFEFLETEILDFTSQDDEGTMVTADGTFRAPCIFQSVLKPKGFDQLKVDLSLKQHFKGWHIKTDKPVFDADKATFMDFDTEQNYGMTFYYVLPFGKHEALVEYTLFSKSLLSDKEYEQKLATYIRDRYGLDNNDFEIVYKEKGVIPMEDRRYPAQYCNHVWNTGAVGGFSKPSTGYTFQRIMERNKNIADALSAGQMPSVAPSSQYRFRVYDIMILYLMEHHPGVTVRIFHDLFQKNSMDRILGFLDENTRIDQEVRIFSSLPWGPFFKSIYKMKRRIFTGA